MVWYLFLQTEYLDDDLFQDDGNDSDYEPLSEKQQRSTKFKKPKLSDIKVFKGKKTVVRKVKILSQIKTEKEGREKVEGKTKSTTITCCKYKIIPIFNISGIRYIDNLGKSS